MYISFSLIINVILIIVLIHVIFIFYLLKFVLRSILVTFERHLKLFCYRVVDWSSLCEIKVFLIVLLIVFIFIITGFDRMMYSSVGELALIILICVI